VIMIRKIRQSLYFLSLNLLFSPLYGCLNSSFYVGTHQQNSTAQCATDSSTGGVLDVAHGGTGRSSLVAYTLLAGGTTTTGPMQQVASTGTTGQVLISNGAGALPTFQDVSASGAIKTITGNSGGALSGSNITFTGDATGLTFAGAGTTQTLGGTLVVGNGGTGVSSLTAYALVTGGTTTSNPVQQVAAVASLGQGATNTQTLVSTSSSSLPTWTDLTTKLTLTAAQIKALRATPITIVSAPGSGKMIYVTGCMVKLNYNTTTYTAAASQTIGLSYNGIAGTSIIAAVAPNSLIVATSTSVRGTVNGGQDVTAYTNVSNQAVVLFNTVATEITVGDSTMDVLLNYQILTI
jgi:hypothetical protein